MNLRSSIFAGSIALTLASLVLWAATGREGYTRWPDPRLERADAPPPAGEAELLASAGMETRTNSTPPDIKSRFALGLLPGGTDPKHLLSVAAAIAASAVASGIAAAVGVRRRHASKAMNLEGAPR